ncbi:MAG: response regulator [Chloroflexales bacterium]|nr:response regulator [Chloroflexales bacterium]
MATRIMVIDDEPLICRLLEYQLGGAGYEVATYARSHEALLELSRAQPDLILLDVMMPEISGWDLCWQIRSSSNIPIIMLTAKDGDDDVVRGLTSGADDYIGKPFSQAQLVARIEAVLRRAQAPAARGRAGLPTPPRGLAPLGPQAAPAPRPAPGPEPAPPDPAPPAGPTARTPLLRLGPHLAEARRQRGLTLHDAGQGSGVRWEFLQAIENEEFSFVPQADLRFALRAYGAFLEVDLKPYASRVARRGRPRPLPLTIGMVAMIAIALVLVTLMM